MRRGSDGPWRGGAVHVLAGRCPTCVFRRGNLMRLAPGRLAGMVRTALSRESVIPCHETLYPAMAPTPPRVRAVAVCAGFWRRYWRDVWPLRLAVHLNLVVYDEPPPAGGPPGRGRQRERNPH